VKEGRGGWCGAHSLIHLDICLLDQLAKSFKLLPIEFTEILRADIAWLAAKAF
jgi:hypothetical protein